MFPLGTVLLPAGFLPLQLFEDRYRQMILDLLEDDREFGVVLIRRGSEVGGGEERCDVGTRARVVEARQAPDGRWMVLAVGLERFRVRSWLPDDPYPWAEVASMPDAAGPHIEEGAYIDLIKAVRRLLAGLSELGEPVSEATFDVADDPGLGIMQLAAVAPLGPHDQQRLLECSQSADRFALLSKFVSSAQETTDRRLTGA